MEILLLIGGVILLIAGFIGIFTGASWFALPIAIIWALMVGLDLQQFMFIWMILGGIFTLLWFWIIIQSETR